MDAQRPIYPQRVRKKIHFMIFGEVVKSDADEVTNEPFEATNVVKLVSRQNVVKLISRQNVVKLRNSGLGVRDSGLGIRNSGSGMRNSGLGVRVF